MLAGTGFLPWWCPCFIRSGGARREGIPGGRRGTPSRSRSNCLGSVRCEAGAGDGEGDGEVKDTATEATWERRRNARSRAMARDRSSIGSFRPASRFVVIGGGRRRSKVNSSSPICLSVSLTWRGMGAIGETKENQRCDWEVLLDSVAKYIIYRIKF